MAFELPALPYAENALEPHMSAKTLALHHGKHHRAYVTKLNELISGTSFVGMSLENILFETHKKPGMQAIFNNAGQHWNHSKFWLTMKPNGGGAMPSVLEKRIKADFNSVEAFKTEFAEKGVAQFGSGWVWLVERAGKLMVTTTSNAVTPIVDGLKPLLVCDVWEHAYYVDYENRRPDFLKTFLEKLVNWEAVAAGRIADPI